MTIVPFQRDGTGDPQFDVEQARTQVDAAVESGDRRAEVSEEGMALANDPHRYVTLYPLRSMRTVLICHEEEPLNRHTLPRWMASFTELAGIAGRKS